MNTNLAVRKLAARRLRQVVASIPRYLREVAHVHGLRGLYEWSYYKLPYSFPLAKFPSRVNLEPTNECNFACRHCPRSVMKRSHGFMDPALFGKVADEVGKHPGCIVKIVGLGEPALHPQFRQLMSQLKKNRVPSILYTNGELFKAFSPEEITNWDVQVLVVSVDGLDANSFARIRVGGNYVLLKQMVREFHRARATLGRHGPELEIRHVIFPNENPADLLRFRQEWLEVADTIKFNYLYFPISSVVPTVRNTRCRDIRREFYIYWDGKVPLCGYKYLGDSHEFLGEIQQKTIEELWNHPRLAEVRRYHLRGDLSAVPFCQTCTFK
jgi:organic radical activating enzyme